MPYINNVKYLNLPQQVKKNKEDIIVNAAGIAVNVADIELIKDNTQVENVVVQLQADLVITVGTGGDYSNVNDAIKFATEKYPRHDLAPNKVEISLLTGFIMTEQVFVDGVNLGWITITSADPVVGVDLTSPAIQIALPAYGSYSSVEMTGLFAGDNNAILPTIACLFDMVSSTDGVSSPFCLANGAQITILKDCGCSNAKGAGVFAIQGAKVYAMGSNLSYATGYAIACFRGAYVAFGGGNGSYSGQGGAYIDVAGILVCDSADFSHATGAGITVDQASIVSGVNVNLSYASTVGANINYGSQASLTNANISNCGDYGIRATGSCTVHAEGANCTNCGTGIQSKEGSIVNAQNAEVTGYTSLGIYALDSGFINARDMLCEKTVGVEDTGDIRVLANGFINATGVTGGQNQGGNKLTGNGMIYDQTVPDYGSEFESEIVATPLLNGWTGTLKYSKTSEGILWIRGSVISGTVAKGTVIFTMPSGYAVPYLTEFKALNASGAIVYDMFLNGASITTNEVLAAGTYQFNILVHVT